MGVGESGWSLHNILKHRLCSPPQWHQPVRYSYHRPGTIPLVCRFPKAQPNLRKMSHNHNTHPRGLNGPPQRETVPTIERNPNATTLDHDEKPTMNQSQINAGSPPSDVSSIFVPNQQPSNSIPQNQSRVSFHHPTVKPAPYTNNAQFNTPGSFIPTASPYPPPPPYTMHPNHPNHPAQHQTQQLLHQMTQLQNQMMLQHQQQMESMERRFQQTLQALTSTLVPNQPPTVQNQSPPPEIQVNNMSQLSHSTPSIQSAPPATLSPDNQSNHSTSTSTVIPPEAQQFLDILAQAKEPKLHFQTLKTTTDFVTWKQMQALKCSLHSKYKSLTTTSATGEVIFDPQMRTESSSTLFMLTYEALGSMTDKFLIEAGNPDGHKLLNQIENYFIDIDTSVGNKETLKREFDNLKRTHDEEYSVFALRYMKKWRQLEQNQVTVPSDDETKAYKFLRALGEKKITKYIVMQLDSKPEWYQDKTIFDLAKKASRYMKKYRDLEKEMPPKKPKKTNREKDSTSVPTEEKELTEKEEKVKRLTQAIQNATHKEPYLKSIRKNNQTKFDSIEFKNACTKAGCYDIYKVVANMEEMEENDTNHPSPPPAAARRGNAASETTPTSNNTHNNVEQPNSNNDEVNVYLSSTNIHSTPPNPLTISNQLTNDPITNLGVETKIDLHNPPSSPTMIVDSGATHTMSGIKEMFQSLTQYPPQQRPKVILGDDNTTCVIHGYGWMEIKLSTYNIRILALYIPALNKSSLYSVKQHIKYVGTYFHAEANEAILAYPSFTVPLLTTNEIEIPIEPVRDSPTAFDFDEQTATTIESDHSKHSLTFAPKAALDILPKHSQSHAPNQSVVQIMKMHENATIPTRKSEGSVGYDIYPLYSQSIPPNSIAKIQTGLSVALPKQIYLKIASRSSLALNNITIEGGTIDQDYRGEIIVLVNNNTNEPFAISPESSIAQGIFERIDLPLLQITDTLPPTKRNNNGFGSTNKISAKTSRFSTFRLNNEFILRINNTNPFRPKACRIRAPITTNLQSTYSKTAPADPTHDEDAEINTLQLHDIDTDSTNPHETLTMCKPKIPIQPKPAKVNPVHDNIPYPTPSSAVPSSAPQQMTMSPETIHRAVGFHNATKLIQNIHTLGNNTIHIQRLPKAEHIEPGEVASLSSQPRNTTPLKLPISYGHIWHMDISLAHVLQLEASDILFYS